MYNLKGKSDIMVFDIKLAEGGIESETSDCWNILSTSFLNP